MKGQDWASRKLKVRGLGRREFVPQGRVDLVDLSGRSVIRRGRGAIPAAGFSLSLFQTVLLYAPGFGGLGQRHVVVWGELRRVGVWVEGRRHSGAVVVFKGAFLRDEGERRDGRGLSFGGFFNQSDAGLGHGCVVGWRPGGVDGLWLS